MKHFLVKDSSGKVLRHGSCREADLELQAGPGEIVLEVTADELGATREAQRTQLQARLLIVGEISPDPVEVVLEALKAKGLVLSEADLAAAKDKLARGRR